ncbi:UPF0481 protein At3g47200-like [Neltuma alba]|uniref:UPF0481 protein At3g47200-like n=1 Tax=Neltuma alba TaxID=207710 RepID=UPI0010A32A7E|nr:UPF0481 protein At3g47200-like [Prosopis alba]
MEAKVINDVKAMIQDTNEDEILSSSRKCCIYRVPLTMRDPNNEDAYYYTPKVVSIGPFHYGNEKLRGMEKNKRMFFKRFVDQSETGKDLVRFVMRWESLVRASYSDEINLDVTEFVTLILADAAFIIELFMIENVIRDKKARQDDKRKARALLEHWWLEAATKHLILLENQLPFFIIEGLYKAVFPSAPSERNSNNMIPLFREITFAFFWSKKFHVELTLVSATELQAAGVKLKAKKGKSLLELNFSRPCFEIPEIFSEDRTEIFFRNMIALEQCHYPFKSYITEYAFILACLINEHQDVDLITYKKIIHNFLGNANDVANLFNGLRENIMGEHIISTHYHEICQRLNRYCKCAWNKRCAHLKRDYCKTPWHAMASAAAIVVILLNLIQTILAFLQI